MDVLAATNGKTHVVLNNVDALSLQINRTNCIYEVQYDFNLNNTELEIPNGCILKFNGGNIRNGVVKGNNTCIDAVPYAIFINVTLSGSWNVGEAYFEWFGATGNGTDDFDAIQNGLNSSIRIFKMFSKTYLIGKYTDETNKIGLNISHPVKIIGTSESDFNNGTIIRAGYASTIRYNIMIQISSQGVELFNLTIIGDENKERVENILSTPISGEACMRLTFKKLFVRHCKSKCIDLHTFLSRLEQVTAGYCKTGIAVHGNLATQGMATSTILTGCYSIEATEKGYDIRLMSYTTLISCAADRCGYNSTAENYNGYQYYLWGCSNVNVLSCGCEDGYNSIYLDCCISTNIYSFTDWSPKNKIINSYNINNQIYLINCYGVALNRCSMGTRIAGKKFIYINSCKHIKIIDSMPRDNNGEVIYDFINSEDCNIISSQNVEFN